MPASVTTYLTAKKDDLFVGILLGGSAALHDSLAFEIVDVLDLPLPPE